MFARAAADLVQDGHFLTVIHGEGTGVERFSGARARGGGNGNGLHPDEEECARFTAVERENRALVALLAKMNVAGIGLRATDARLVQLRRQYGGKDKTSCRVEAARLDSRWLDLICGNKGVPVLSNLSSWAGGEDHLIDPDHMAAVCAANWNADALIYVTEEGGVPDTHGGILRWLDIESNHGLQTDRLSDEMRRRLDSCAIALRHGVRRVRILPLSNVDCLPLFYISPIEYGTEVIAAVPRV